MLCTWDAVWDDCGPKIAATPVFIRWQTRFDAWKLSCGIILSISACSLERGSILLSALILSTAYRNAISCGSVVWWSLSLGNGENKPPNKMIKRKPMIYYALRTLIYSLYHTMITKDKNVTLDFLCCWKSETYPMSCPEHKLFIQFDQQYMLWILNPTYGIR